MILDKITEYEEVGNSKDDVDISIWCVTYNHIKYIKKTLEGFLMQKTNFSFAVLIYDDASTDGTSDVVRDYAKRFPSVFHAFIMKNNTYKHPQRMTAVSELKKLYLTGKYTCVCEGDDYWIYDQKLQRQYEFMESHSEVSLCMHNAINYNEGTSEVYPLIMDMDSGYLDDDEIILFKHGHPPTASYFYRTECLNDRPVFFDESPVGDEPLRYWLAHHGKVYYMDKVWSVRNYMHDGSWNATMKNNTEFHRIHNYKWVTFLKKYNEHTNYRYASILEENICRICINEILLEKNNLFKESFENLFNLLVSFKKNYNNEFDTYFDAILPFFLKKYPRFEESFFEYIIKSNLDIYIYGAGEEAMAFANKLLANNIKWECFIVSRRKGFDSLLGHQVVQYDQLQKDKNDVLIYLAMNYHNRIQVLPLLKKDGYTYII